MNKANNLKSNYIEMTKDQQKKIDMYNADRKAIKIRISDLRMQENDMIRSIGIVYHEVVAKYLEDTQVISDESGELLTNDAVIISNWECSKSPIGLCIEDGTDFEYSCICCGNPNERQ